ncbi:MAG: DNA repair protein RecN [Bacteroidota bacterium]
MLQQLYIRNYALIREIRMDFSDGFSVMTGETGAGKSILLGALGLVLGDRADTTVMRDMSEKCIVEAFFLEPRLSTHPLAIECDLEGESEWCIRRELNGNGKSRAFLNDTPITLTQLQSFASELVDLHQQFDTLEITEGGRQREWLDVMSGQLPQVKEYQSLYSQWRSGLQQLQALETKQAQLQQEQAYQLHVLQELEDASFQAGEIESLEERVKAGGQSEGMSQAISGVVEKLQGDGENLLQHLRLIQQTLSVYENHSADIKRWVEQFRSIDLEMRELSRDMDRHASRFQFDPAELANWQERLSMGFRLLKKHGLKHSQELVDLQSRLKDQLNDAHTLVAQLDEWRQQTSRQEALLREKAAVLHAKRAATIQPWTDQVNQLLHQVGMPTARFGVMLEPTELGPDGMDDCQFLFDANFRTGKETPNWQPLRKVASGGELSRLMLCIKSLVADQMQLPTLIFDEIDTGISGEAARQVGRLLRDLGNNRQVICVTHQPQVAAKGEYHWHVIKSETAQDIETQVELLTNEQRVEVLARIIGGESPTDTARQNAAELLLR